MGLLKGCMKLMLRTIVCSIIVAPFATADSDVEREELHRILDEIRYLEKSLIIARNRVNPNDNTRFNYDALSGDLQKISEGIADYLNDERREPRKLIDVSGEYTHGS